MADALEGRLAAWLGWRRVGLGLLLLVAVALRSVNLADFRTIELDERSWLMVGTSVWRYGVPTAWTIYHGPYAEQGIMSHGWVAPYLDHPPLFSLLIGGWAVLWDQLPVGDLDWALVRAPMIGLAMLSMVTTYLLARELFGQHVATLVLVLFVFFPSHVVTSRIIAAEHVIGWLLVLGLYLLARRARAPGNQKWIYAVWLGVVCLVSLPIKLSAGVVPLALLVVAARRRSYRLVGVMLVATVMAGLLVMSWGAYYNWELWRDVQFGHSGRLQSFTHFWSIFVRLNIGQFEVYDPLVIIGMIGMFVAAADRRLGEQRWYLVGALLATSLLFVMVAPWESYGWYKYSLYPLMALGAGYLLGRTWEGELGWWFLWLPYGALMLASSDLFATHGPRRGVVLVGYGLVLAALIARRRRWYRWLVIALLPWLLWWQALWSLHMLGYHFWPVG